MFPDIGLIRKHAPALGLVWGFLNSDWPEDGSAPSQAILERLEAVRRELATNFSRLNRVLKACGQGDYPDSYTGDPELLEASLMSARQQIQRLSLGLMILAAQTKGLTTTVEDDLAQSLADVIAGTGDAWKNLRPVNLVTNTPRLEDLVLQARLLALADLVGPDRKSRQQLYDAAEAMGFDRAKARNLIRNSNEGRIGNPVLHRHYVNERDRLEPRYNAGISIAELMAGDLP